MSDMSKNYYDVLGIDKKASKDDIKKAFRKLAQKHHPDKGGDESKFKEITEAYAVLADEKRRREYDSYGQSFAGGAPGGAGGFDFSGFGNGGVEFDLSDLFEGFGDIFGAGTRGPRGKRGRDISIDIEVSFKESVLGVTRKVLITKVGKCDLCEGTGAKSGTELQTCDTCNGAGRVRETRNSPFGTFASVRSCPACEGAGKIPKEKCEKCAGRGVLKREEEIKIGIPAGMDNGEMIRMPGLGEAVKSGIPGDLYVKVHVHPHSVFKKQGMNLVMDVPVKLTDALLGTQVTVETVEGNKLDVKVPPMATPEETLRLKGRGVSADGVKGDLLIKLSVSLPKKLSTKAKKSIEDLKSEGL